MWVHNEIIRNIARSCAIYGIREQQVYTEAGPIEANLQDPDGKQDWKTGVRVWEAVLKLTGYRFAGLSFGKNINFAVLGWIAPLTTSSPTLKLAWKSFSDFFPLMSDMMVYHLQEQKDWQIRISYQPAAAWTDTSPVTAAMATEHAMSLTLSMSSYLCGHMVRPVSAGFTHAVGAKNRGNYNELFGNVLFNQTENYLLFDAATAQLPVITFNRMMYDEMQKLCVQKLSELQAQTSYTGRVAQILNSKQTYYAPKLDEAAAMLNTSARTLQRKLKEEHTTYQQVLEAHQIEIASQLLKQPGTRVKEVAFALGFTSLQSFSRAFKRKLGISPTQLRAQ
ncbi:MAG: AraC family transcriptional regulator [Sphingobacteriales bacterium]|nr:MAG: AraC family transcriptional regulator [Sphingobacteriales bacterium]